ncbi:MAG: DEAD/DEAH box helicase [Balneolaceae bacterium]|nr:DEAD/DEAH box helicase [Balneolaceae bacterium]
MSFEEFGLSPEILSGLADVRIDKPTPLQNDVIPSALQGKDILVKNEAEEEGVFLIPALQKLTTNGEVSGTKVLILTPSIERAKHIDELIWAMGYHAQISSAPISMKGNREEQEQAVKDGAPILVANPGRLIEILNKNKLKLTDLELIVIDEAQGMENYSLVSRVKDILKQVEGRPQTLVFSKEYNKATKELADFALQDAEVIGFDVSASDASEKKGEKEEPQDSVNAESQAEEQEENAEAKEEEYVLDMAEVKRKLAEASVDVVLNPEEEKEDKQEADHKSKVTDEEPGPVPKNLEQGYIHVPPRAKISTLLAHLDDNLSDRIVVFAASKRTTDRLFRIIRKKGWGVVSINEGLNEGTYNERFQRFTSGDMKILLVGGISATDVEIEFANQVINYDVPSEVEEYKYRAELVGRGKASRMISLVSKMDRDDINKIVEEVGFSPTEIPLPKEVKEKKKSKGKKDDRKKKSGKKKSNKKKNNEDSRRRKRRKPQKAKKNKKGGLPLPTYDGLSGGREGKGKRPAPNDNSGAFGWIKKLFK